MRVLVFGNSHAACVLEAWREGAAGAGHEVEFLVRSGGGVAGHRLTGTRISAATEEFAAFLARLGLAAEQDLRGFDVLAIVGSEMSLFHVVQVLNVYRILDWTEAQRDDLPALTEAVLRRAVEEALLASNAGRLLASLRAVPELADMPIRLLPQPFPSERVLGMARAGVGAGFKRMVREGTGARAAAVLAEVGQGFAARFGAQFHPQPAETVAHGCLTDAAHSTRARRLVDLGQFQPEGDILHANIAYGRLLLGQILAPTEMSRKMATI